MTSIQTPNTPEPLMTDSHLLADYLATRSDAAFTTLVQRHLDLVYAAALRQVRDPALAEDIAQAVFILGAKKAPHLRPHTSLSGWLLKTTHFCVLDARKRAQRRLHHERQAALMRQESQPPAPPADDDIARHLDRALAHLSLPDRSVLSLRYLENQSVDEVAHSLGLSKNAAQKRLTRALARLQRHLPASLSASSLAALPIIHAPAHLAATLPHAILQNTAAAHTSVSLIAKGAHHAMTLTKIKLIAAVGAALAVSTTTAFYVATNVPAPKSLVTAPTSAPASAPTAVAHAAPTADPDYYTTYALKPDQYIAVLPHVDPAIRDSLVADLSPGRGAANKPAHAPTTMVIQWQNEQPTLWGYNSAPGFSLNEIYAGIIDVYSTEFHGSYLETLALETQPIPGDVVFRAGGTPEQYAADLQTIVAEHYKRPITVSIQNPLMDCVVLSGKYHFTHAPNAHNAVHFYLNEVDTASPQKPPRGGACTPKQFARYATMFVSQPVVIESPHIPKNLFWNFDTDAPIPLPKENIPLLLQRLTEQTNLTVTHEKCPIPCLVIAIPPTAATTTPPPPTDAHGPIII